jgi:hypothetical protein
MSFRLNPQQRAQFRFSLGNTPEVCQLDDTELAFAYLEWRKQSEPYLSKAELENSTLEPLRQQWRKP